MAVKTTNNLTSDTLEALQDLRSFAAQSGIAFTIVSSRRTCGQQRGLFDQGRSTPGGIVTNADGCQSWHVLGRAVDISIPGGTTADYQKLGEFWEDLGGHWGGRFSGLFDPGHFEWHPGMTIEEVCPNPDDCEEAVALQMKLDSGRRRTPFGGMLAVAGIAAAVVIWSEPKWL